MMNFNQNTPLVFQWRNRDVTKLLKFAPIIGLLSLSIIPIIFWLAFPAESLSQIDWSAMWQKMLLKPKGLVIFITYPIFAAATYWGFYQHQKNAKLTLTHDFLVYSSGIPLINRLIDWRLDLNEFRADKLAFGLIGRPISNSQPLLGYALTWGWNKSKQLRPAAWVLPNQIEVQPASSFSFWRYISWKKPENQLRLQQQFDQLPLIQTLKECDIELPRLFASKQMTGLDLMAHPRMKAVVISFFVALAGAFVLFHLMRHQHYFVALPTLAQYALGVFVGLCTFVWLWTEKISKDVSTDKAGLRTTQILLAFLMAVPAGLCSPSLPLLLSNLLQPAQEQTFSLQKIPLTLKSNDSANMPDILLAQAHEYWLSLPEGEPVSLPVRKGFAGLWWQYDSSVLQDKVEQFYDAQPRMPARR